VAEETGLILPMGKWVLRTACESMVRLVREHDIRPCPMLSVNISGRQFQQGDLFDQVRLVIEETGFPPERLKLEVTESVIMDNAELAVKTLEQLKSLNLQISIDDFGTGYSSLSYLQRFPVDMLKVDRSFVAIMRDSEESLELVRTIVGLAHSLGLQVVAEGVETPDQARTLAKLGCEFVQGFYYSTPVDEAALVRNKLYARKYEAFSWAAP